MSENMKDEIIRERLAARGIPLDMTPPIMPPRPPQPPKEIWYDMSWPWRIIVTEQNADRIIDFCKTISGVEYVTYGAYDGPQTLETGDLKPVKMSKTEVAIYKPMDARAITQHQQKYSKAEEQFKLDKKAYNEWLDQINELDAEIDAELWAEKERVRRLNSLRHQWIEYLVIAKQDSDVAKQFFVKAHSVHAYEMMLTYIANEEK